MAGCTSAGSDTKGGSGTPTPKNPNLPAAQHVDRGACNLVKCSGEGICVLNASGAPRCACDSGFHAVDTTCAKDTTCTSARAPAGDISIARVEVLQGTTTTVAVGSTTLAPNQFNAPVVANREALVRVHVQTRSGFASRPIVARLRLSALTREVTKIVSTSSAANRLDSTFNFEISGDDLQPGGTYAVELLENARCGSSIGVVSGARLPSTDAGDFGAVDSKAMIRVVVVTASSGGRQPRVTNSVLNSYYELFSAMYPVSESFMVDARSTVLKGDYDFSSRDGWEEFLGDCTFTRASDKVSDGTYYYCVAKPADSFSAYCHGQCIAGLGYVVNPGSTMNQAAVGIEFGDGSLAAIGAHELGHNLGLGHAPCNTTSAAEFPYKGGQIGVDGFNRYSGQLKLAGSYSDVMGYCPGQWISDYNFGRAFDRLKYIGSVNARSFDPYFDRKRLTVHARPSTDGLYFTLTAGHVFPAGTTVKGEPVAASYLTKSGEIVDEVVGVVFQFDHSDAVSISVPIPVAEAEQLAIDGYGVLMFNP